MNKSIRISGLVCALMLASNVAGAAGLGRLTVQSALGQPLRAEIELLSVSKDELGSLTARLASPDAFRQARIDRTEAMGNLRFAVDQRPNGQPIVRITSATGVSDPFLDLLIELSWNSGRMIREYTILLDPLPDTKPVEPTRTVVAPEAGRPVESKPATAPVAVVAQPAKPVTQAAPPAAPVAAKRYGPVKAGETLRGIAGKVKPSEVTLEQMMAGLYQANKGAFASANMNRLKRGQVLNVPTAETALTRSPKEAARMVQGHTNEWHAYRRKLASMAGTVPSAEEPAASGKIAPKAEDRAPAPAGAPKDVLQLSKGEPGSQGGKADAAAQARLRSMEEELAAKSRALKEAQERVTQLERTVKDMQHLLDLKTQEAAQPPAPATVPTEPPPAAEEAPPPPAPAPAPVAQPKPAPAPTPLPVSEPTSSWLSTFISNPLYIGGVIAALLLSGLLWMMMVGNRRKQGLNKFEDSIMTGGEFKNNAVFNPPATGGAAVTGAATEGSMLLTDFSRMGMGAIDSHEVDPIAEAEVYMAYGRDAQAEEILKEALAKDPGRHEIALKLLEIYASRKDTLVFETTASELYASLGGQNTPVWQRAAEMGRTIDPDNPLYRLTPTVAMASPAAAVAAGVAATAAAAASFQAEPPPSSASTIEDSFTSSDHELGGSEPDALDDAVAWDAPPIPDDNTLEFAPAQEGGWDEPAVEAIAPPAPTPTFEPAADFSDNVLEFSEADLTPAFDVSETPVDLSPVATETEPPALDTSLDFDAAPQVEETAVETMPVLDLSDIDLDLAVTDEAAFAAEVTEVPVTEAVPAPSKTDDVGLEFEPAAFETAADFDTLDLEAPAIPPVVEVPEPVVDEPSPAEPAADEIGSALREEVNTKLDLAKAYLEMGDREGAREILQEVLNEGDATQKAEADRLMSEAG